MRRAAVALGTLLLATAARADDGVVPDDDALVRIKTITVVPAMGDAVRFHDQGLTRFETLHETLRRMKLAR